MSNMQEFEGASVVDFKAKIPATSVECDPYKRGTILRLAVEVRVKNVRFEEDPKTGDVVRHHILGIEEISVVSNFDPAQNVAAVGGSASSHPQQTDDDAEELGLEIGRSSDQWPSQIAVHDGQVVNTDTGKVIGKAEEVTDEEVEASLTEGTEGDEPEPADGQTDLAELVSASNVGF